MTGLRVCTFAATVVLAGTATAQCPFGPVLPADNHGYIGAPRDIAPAALPITVIGDTTVDHPGAIPAGNWDPVVVQDGVDPVDWPSPATGSNDGWWRWEVPADDLYTFSLCGTTGDCHEDTQLKIFSTNASGDPVEIILANDDLPCDVQPTSSAIECVALEAGTVIVIVVDGWVSPGDDGEYGGGDDVPFNGIYELVISQCEPCDVTVTCPPDGVDEEEECGNEQNNLGCFDDDGDENTPDVDLGVSAAACGGTVCGTLLRELSTDETTIFIDIDTFELDVPEYSQVVTTANAEFPIEVGLVVLEGVIDPNLPYDCANENGFISGFAQSGFDCGTVVSTSPCVEGPRRVQVAPARDFPVFFSCDGLTWGSNYTLSFECVPCNSFCDEGDAVLAHQTDANFIPDPASPLISCFWQSTAGDPLASADNEWGRMFIDAVDEPTVISCVEFGVAIQFDFLDNGLDQPVTVNVYSATTAAPDANMTLLGSEEFAGVRPGLTDAIQSFTFTDPVAIPANTNIFVSVFWDTPDINGPSTTWTGPMFPATNDLPETGEDYWNSDGCGVAWDLGDNTDPDTQYNTLIRAILGEVGQPCPEDLTGDGVVSGPDLFQLLGVWGACPGCPEDLTGDDVVSGPDLFQLLGVWGDCP